MGKSRIVLEANNIKKTYGEGDNSFVIIQNSSFSVNESEIISLVGESGSGKSTLLQICGLLDRPTSGDIILNSVTTKNLSNKELTKIRKYDIGFVYQSHNLFSEFTALENVMLPLMIRNGEKNIKERSSELLCELGLKDRIHHKPSELSGGEKQRVAIARALITNPSLILADEPTGNLDTENSNKILDVLVKSVKNHNTSLLMVTHDWNMTKFSDRIITIENKIVKDVNKRSIDLNIK